MIRFSARTSKKRLSRTAPCTTARWPVPAVVLLRFAFAHKPSRRTSSRRQCSQQQQQQPFEFERAPSLVSRRFHFECSALAWALAQAEPRAQVERVFVLVLVFAVLLVECSPRGCRCCRCPQGRPRARARWGRSEAAAPWVRALRWVRCSRAARELPAEQERQVERGSRAVQVQQALQGMQERLVAQAVLVARVVAAQRAVEAQQAMKAVKGSSQARCCPFVCAQAQLMALLSPSLSPSPAWAARRVSPLSSRLSLPLSPRPPVRLCPLCSCLCPYVCHSRPRCRSLVVSACRCGGPASVKSAETQIE